MFRQMHEFEFFIKYSDKLLKEVFTHMPCHDFLLSQLNLDYGSTPNEVHRVLKVMKNEELRIIRNNITSCTCSADDHHRSLPEDICMKKQMRQLINYYLNWNLKDE